MGGPRRDRPGCVGSAWTVHQRRGQHRRGENEGRIWRGRGCFSAEPSLEAFRLAVVPGCRGFARAVLGGAPRGSHRRRRRAGRRTVPSADCETLADWVGNRAPVEGGAQGREA